MRLQKQLSKKVGNIEYAKYVIVVPPNSIKELDWKAGQELNFEIKDKKLVIGKK